MDPQAQRPVSFFAMRETNREWTLINANRVGLKEGLTEDRKDSRRPDGTGDNRGTGGIDNLRFLC